MSYTNVNYLTAEGYILYLDPFATLIIEKNTFSEINTLCKGVNAIYVNNIQERGGTYAYLGENTIDYC